MTFAIAAAGTGGHVYPGLAVGEALVESGIDPDEVLFVGGDRLEATVYPEAGFPFLGVELAGLQRRLTMANLRIPVTVWRATSAITAELRRRRVGVVLGLGGYVTVPAGLAARRLRIPVAVSEQNAHAGLANRVVGRIAQRRFGAFPTTEGLPGALWTGNPIRASVLTDVDRTEARLAYGLEPEGLVVGVFGGSLGAGSLNAAVAGNVEVWRNAGIVTLHLVGSRNADMVERAAGHPSWIVVPFEERMDRFYAACDLLVARAGGAVAEVTARGVPAVLVPGGFGSGGHQAANARVLAEAGAALMLDEEDLHRLGPLIVELALDRDRRDAMSRACGRLAKPDAAATIAQHLREMHG